MSDLDQASSDSVAPSAPLLALCLIPILALAALALLLTNRLVVDSYITDDAFISFRYSLNLANGSGPVWQPGSSVEGYTNFGWVLIIAIAAKLGANPIGASQAIGLAASVVTIALIPIASSQLRPTFSMQWWLLVGGTCAALLANTAFNLWTFAGLETPLFTCLIFAALTAHWYEERTHMRRAGLSAFVLLLCALTRPDGLVIWGVIAAWKLWATFRGNWRVTDLLFWVLCFTVPFAIYWGWRWAYYGHFFPNTYYLKSGSTPDFYERGARYVWDFVVVYWVWLGLAAVASVWKELHARYRPATAGVSLVLVWCAYTVASGGDWMPYYRFLVPIVPVLYLLTMNGILDLVELLRARTSRPWGFALALVGVCVLVFSAFRPFDNARAKDPFGFQTDPMPGDVDREAHREIGLWMRNNIPPGFTVAQIATGIVPYYSELPTLDMLGVNDEHIAHLDTPVGRGPAGHEKQDGPYILLSMPEVIWLSIGPEADPRNTPEDYKPPIDRRLAPVVTAVSQNAYVWVYYRPVAIRLSEGWLNLLVRTDVTTPALASGSPDGKQKGLPDS